MSNCYKIMCGCEIWISAFTMQCKLNEWRSIHKEKLISDYEISHSRISGKDKKDEYINEVYPNGSHWYER